MKTLWLLVAIAVLSSGIVVVAWTGSSPTDLANPHNPANPRNPASSTTVKELVAKPEPVIAKESTDPDRRKPQSQPRRLETSVVLQMDLATLNSHLKLRLAADKLSDEEFRTDVEAFRQFRLEEYKMLFKKFNSGCADRAYRIHKSRMGGDSSSSPTKPDPSKGPVLATSTTVDGTVFLYAQDHPDLQSAKIKVDDIANKFRKDIEELSRRSP